MYTHITIDDTTREFRTEREAKNYLFGLLEQHPSPSHIRQIRIQLEILLNKKLEAKQIEAEQINRELIQAQRNYNEAVDALTDTQHQLIEARAIIEAMKRETARIKDARAKLAKAYETRGNLLDAYIDDAKRHRQILADIHSMTEADKVF